MDYTSIRNIDVLKEIADKEGSHLQRLADAKALWEAVPLQLDATIQAINAASARVLTNWTSPVDSSAFRGSIEAAVQELTKSKTTIEGSKTTETIQAVQQEIPTTITLLYRLAEEYHALEASIKTLKAAIADPTTVGVHPMDAGSAPAQWGMDVQAAEARLEEILNEAAAQLSHLEGLYGQAAGAVERAGNQHWTGPRSATEPGGPGGPGLTSAGPGAGPAPLAANGPLDTGTAPVGPTTAPPGSAPLTPAAQDTTGTPGSDPGGPPGTGPTGTGQPPEQPGSGLSPDDTGLAGLPTIPPVTPPVPDIGTVPPSTPLRPPLDLSPTIPPAGLPLGTTGRNPGRSGTGGVGNVGGIGGLGSIGTGGSSKLNNQGLADVRQPNTLIAKAARDLSGPAAAVSAPAPAAPTPAGTTTTGASTGNGMGMPPPMAPPMATSGGGGGRPGPGTAKNPALPGRGRSTDPTPGVPQRLRGRSGRTGTNEPLGQPPTARRRNKEEEVDTLQLLDEELWQVETADVAAPPAAGGPQRRTTH